MAFNLSDSDDADAVLHDINVTPFIDVMLVLLIIFMVAAPLATSNVPLDLPVSSARAAPEPTPPVTISLKTDRSVYVGEQPLQRAALAAHLDAMLKGDRETRLFVRADKAIAYGDLMELMDDLRRAGYHKVALVTAEHDGG